MTFRIGSRLNFWTVHITGLVEFHGNVGALLVDEAHDLDLERIAGAVA